MSIALGTDGNLWFPAIAYSHFGTSQPGGAIGRVMLNGKLRLFFLPTNCFPSYITRGPDGKLWFLATQGRGQVGSGVDSLPGFRQYTIEMGSITPAGTFHLIPLPASPQRYPDSITAGPDGNLWFTELVSPDLHNVQAPHAFEIARMTPSGKITDFPLSPSTDSPAFILAGPDGNLWFAIGSAKGQNAHGKLGRITPQGQITVFDLPDNISDVAGITRGSDGNLWLSGNGYILRVTPHGQVKEFALSTLAGTAASDQLGAFALAAGSDGAIWFLSNQHWVGRMTTGGVLQQYPYPRNVDFPALGQQVLLTSIFGSDGTLWITNGDRLGHFV
jgi:virginiamycin B lyase